MNKRSLTIIFLTVFIDTLGFGIVVPLLPLYTTTFGASAATCTALLASYLIAQTICAPILGRLSDRFGRRPVLIASLAGAALSFLLLGLAPSLFWLFMARIVSGITGGSISAAKSYIADITTKENRAHGMGMLGAGIALGYCFGPPLGGWLSKESLTLPYFVAGTVSLLNCIAAIFFLPAPPVSEHEPETDELTALAYARRVLALPHLGSYLWIIFCATLTFSLFTGTYALLCQEQFGLSREKIGMFLGFVGIVATIVQGGMIRPLVKRYGELPLVVTGAVLLMFGMLLLPWASSTPRMLAALFMLATGNSLTAPALLALVSHEAPPTEQGRVLGFEQGVESIARIVGLLVGGGLFDLVRWTPFLFGSLLTGLATLPALAQLSKKKSRPPSAA